MTNNAFYTIIILLIHFSNSLSQDTLKTENEYSLEQITVTSDKLDTKLIDVPTKIEIISEAEINAANGNRLPDILRSNSEVFIKSYGLTPALNTISINGLGAEHTLIIVDGIKMNSFQNSHIDLSLIPKENIDRIEIIPNGISSIYGSDALGGVVNIVTKNRENLAENRSAKYNASFSTGSFGSRGYSLGFYREFSDLSARLNFSSESSDGNFDYYFNDGINKILKERQNAGYSIYDISLSAQYLLSKDNFIKLLSTYSDQDKKVPGIETGTSPPPTMQIDRNWNNILSIHTKLNESILIKTSFNFQNNLMRYSVGKYLNSNYKNIVFSGGSEIRVKGDNFGITAGYDFVRGDLKSSELNKGISRNQHALFASTSYAPIQWIKLYPSLRYDYITDISEVPFTYKFGINLQPISGTGFSMRGNFGKNFRAPSFNDLYWKNTGNENLDPENSYNFEGGIYYSFDNQINGQIEISYTYISAENKIVWSPQSNGLWSPENIAESVSNNYSIGFNAVKKLYNDLTIRLNSGLNFVNTKKISSSFEGDPTKNKFIPFIPLESANINLGAEYKFLEMNLFFSFNGERYSDYSNESTMEKFNIVDGNISSKFLLFEAETTLRFEVNNIFKTEYEIVSGYPMPLRFYKINLIINY